IDVFSFFFFSSRRRHTRCLSDWSSDVSLPIWLEAIGFNRLIYLRFEQAHQLEFIPLRHCEHFPDCAALDHFLNVPARFFIWIERSEERRVGKDRRDRQARRLI